MEHVVVVLSEGTGRCLDVLRGKNRGYVRRHQFVLCHLIGFQPYTHTIISSEQHEFAHSADTLDAGFDIDFHVIVEELVIIAAFRVIDTEGFQLGVLLFFGVHAHLYHLGRQQALGGSHAVLYVDRCHVGVGPLLEIDKQFGIAAVGGGRCDIGHALHTVDGLLQRYDNRFLYGFGIGSGIVGVDSHGRRCNVRILFDR